MLRSIIDDWIFPYFVDWDMAIGVDEYHQLICKAYEEGFTIVATTCDQGGKNEGLRNKLKITPKEPFCIIKVNDDTYLKVFFLHDWVHIFKVGNMPCYLTISESPKMSHLNFHTLMLM